MTDAARGDRDGATEVQIKLLRSGVAGLQRCTTHEDAYGAVIETAVEILGFDWCCLAKADDGMFEIAAASPEAPVDAGDRYLSIDEGIAGQCYRTGESVLLEEISDDDRSEPVDEAFQSALSIPLGTWGVFQCAANQPSAFDEMDLELAEILLSNAREAFRRIDNEAELRRQNERLEEFASVVSHDLQSPLTVARGRLELYRESGDEDDAEATARALERMEQMIGGLLTLAREGEDVGETEPVELGSAAEGAWEGIDVEGGSIVIETTTTVQADPSRLRQLLENLFRNAVEHGSTNPRSQAHEDAVEHGGGTVTVTVGDREDGFYVADDGPGIPEAEREDVFEMGYSMAEDGTGFGLAIVETIAEAHGWTVECVESDGGGARFDIRVR